jgi:hypothetical protein
MNELHNVRVSLFRGPRKRRPAKVVLGEQTDKQCPTESDPGLLVPRTRPVPSHALATGLWVYRPLIARCDWFGYCLRCRIGQFQRRSWCSNETGGIFKLEQSVGKEIC